MDVLIIWHNITNSGIPANFGGKMAAVSAQLRAPTYTAPPTAAAPEPQPAAVQQPQVPAVPAIIENVRVDAEGNRHVRRYRLGSTLGKVRGRTSGLLAATHAEAYNRPLFALQGGFAKCYKLTSLETNRIYAGKVVNKELLHKMKAKSKVSEATVGAARWSLRLHSFTCLQFGVRNLFGCAAHGRDQNSQKPIAQVHCGVRELF